MANEGIDYRDVENRVLRRYLKAEAFREIYGGGSAERGPIVERTGRMTVSQPPLHLPTSKDGT